MSTLVYTHTDCLKHDPGTSHPESPQRLKAVLEVLEAPEFKALAWREAPMGTRMQAMLVHDQDFVDAIADAAPDSGRVALDGGDTVMSPGSWAAVMRCIGAACAGVDAVMAGEADNVFCATRPCGHHAEPDRAMGFCIFNQAAIAAVHALQAHGLERVAVVDFDVHHGNGTQAAFFARPELFYASSHQSPLYPGTGSRTETGVAGNIVNVPLPPGCGSQLFRERIAARDAAGAACVQAGLHHHLGGLRCAPARSAGGHEPRGRRFWLGDRAADGDRRRTVRRAHRVDPGGRLQRRRDSPAVPRRTSRR